jgi:hypothetical protein
MYSARLARRGLVLQSFGVEGVIRSVLLVSGRIQEKEFGD